MPDALFSEFEPGSLVAERYKILEVIGSGAVGRVYKVLDQALDNDLLALKFLFPHLVQDAVAFARFRNELLIARKLTHPNIVKLYDFISSGRDQHFISMEYVEGRSLAKRITCPAFPPLTFPEVIHVLSEIARGMAAAHAAKVVHRDLKPENVLISDAGQVKIADFGLARSLLTNKGLTETGLTVGTPYYMSPEQIMGDEIDGRADIYSLGIIAYELVTGRKPFADESWFNLSTLHLTQPMPQIGDAHFSVPPWFEEFVERCTAKAPKDRYSSAEEVVRALEQHQESAAPAKKSLKPVELPKAPKEKKDRARVGLPAVFAAASGLLFLIVAALFVCRFVPILNINVGGRILAWEKSRQLSFPMLKVLLGIEYSSSPEELARAVMERDAEKTALLLKAGVDPASVLADGRSAYDLAIERADSKVIQALLEGGADPNYRNGMPLLYAVGSDSRESVAILLRANAFAEARDPGTGRTALMLAIRNRNDGAVLDLLNAGADVNAKDKAGQTPLMHAAQAGDIAILDRLFDWKPQLNETDNLGQTAMTIALSRGNREIAERLKNMGAEISITGRDGRLRAAPRKP